MISLLSLDLSHNQLNGVIPTSLGNLTSLVSLVLSDNQLEGAIIPTSYSHLCNLRDINFSNLKCKQQIYEIFEILTPGVSHELRLYLSKNQLNGNPFKILGSIPKLSFLDIDDNLFQGVVHEDDLANFTTLKELLRQGTILL